MHKHKIDRRARIIPPNGFTGLFQYFIKVIPTVVMDRKVVLSTNQYTFTERFRPILLPDFSNLASLQNAVLPGIFFVYDISPFMVEVRRTHMPLTHLLTRLVAIVGGVFSVLGIFDTLLSRFRKC